jgi:hypothetical protein
MVITIAIIALALLSFAFAGGFFSAVLALKTGLKWQMQTQRGQKPTILSGIPRGRAQAINTPDLLTEILTGKVSDPGKE